jgi:Ni/Co efflux regulator RcnB
MSTLRTTLKQLALATAIGSLMVAAPASFAQGQGKGHGQHHGKHAAKQHQKAVKKAYKEEQKAYKRWAKGQYIPRDYIVERYYVQDYRAYDLAPPPNGYMWVRPYPEDDTYYMVQLASGLISQIFGR